MPVIQSNSKYTSCHPHVSVHSTHKNIFISTPYEFWHTNTLKPEFLILMRSTSTRYQTTMAPTNYTMISTFVFVLKRYTGMSTPNCNSSCHLKFWYGTKLQICFITSWFNVSRAMSVTWLWIYKNLTHQVSTLLLWSRSLNCSELNSVNWLL